MNALILDRFNKQPIYLRFLWRILTTIGWGFWLYLWLPLIAPFASHFGIFTDSFSTQTHWQQLVTTLASHFSTVCILISLFLAWALLQRIGEGKIRNHKSKKRFTSSTVTQSSGIIEQNFTRWRKMKRIVAVHDDKTGQIQQVESKK